jgi:hypothetical protein
VLLDDARGGQHDLLVRGGRGAPALHVPGHGAREEAVAQHGVGVGVGIGIRVPLGHLLWTCDGVG